MRALIRHKETQKYLCRLDRSRGGNHEWTTNIRNAIVYSSKGVANGVSESIPNTEVIVVTKMGGTT